MSDKNGTFLSQRSSSWSPQVPDVYRLLLKEEGMLHSGKHGLDPTFVTCHHQIQDELIIFMSHSCSIRNKILVYEICKSLYFVFLHFIQHYSIQHSSCSRLLKCFLSIFCLKILGQVKKSKFYDSNELWIEGEHKQPYSSNSNVRNGS